MKISNLTKLPIIGPILRQANSRKFTNALIAIVVIMATNEIPGLAPYRQEFFIAISIIFGTLILGIGWEDAAEKGKSDYLSVIGEDGELTSDDAKVELAEAISEIIIDEKVDIELD